MKSAEVVDMKKKAMLSQPMTGKTDDEIGSPLFMVGSTSASLVVLASER